MTFNQYWNESVPWSFKDEKLSYEQRRKLRYELQDYMLKLIPFGEYKGKQVLEIGCGTGIDSVEFAKNGSFVTGKILPKSRSDGRAKPFEKLVSRGRFCFGQRIKQVYQIGLSIWYIHLEFCITFRIFMKLYEK